MKHMLYKIGFILCENLEMYKENTFKHGPLKAQ